MLISEAKQTYDARLRTSSQENNSQVGCRYGVQRVLLNLAIRKCISFKQNMKIKMVSSRWFINV